VSNPTNSSSRSIRTQIVNAGLEVASVVVSFLSCGKVRMYSDLPGGESVGRTSFCRAIRSIFADPDVGDAPAAPNGNE
jgi:hypothetical protein